MTPGTDNRDAFPPRLHGYLTTLQTTLAAVLETEKPSEILSLIQALQQAPRVIQNIQIAAFADWVLQHHTEIIGGPDAAAVQWAYRTAELIVSNGNRTPTPSTAEVFSDPRFDQLIAEASKIFPDMPARVEDVQAKIATHRLANQPAASEAVQ